MADSTNIEWADSTANLWIGCTKVSPGCDNCYAAADWQDRKNRVLWGPHGDRSYCKAGWALIKKMQARAARNGGVDPDLGRKRRIFVNSLSDFFDNHRSIIWRADAFDTFEASPDVILILITKRPGNVMKMVPPHWLEPGGWPAHVWLGVSVEDQAAANQRIPDLLATPAAVRFLSCEPLLGPVDLGGQVTPALSVFSGYDWYEPLEGRAYIHDEDDHLIQTDTIGKIEWVIAGGESGPGARPMHPDWVRALRDQCRDAGTAFFFKQWGEWFPGEIDNASDGTGWRAYPDIDHDPGADRWEFGFVKYQDGMLRVGKKRTGRLLDGVEHSEFPA